MQIFEEILFFKLCTTTTTKKPTTTEKQTINSTYLVSGGCRRLAEGVCLIVCFSVFVVVYSLKKRISTKICTFRPGSSN